MSCQCTKTDRDYRITTYVDKDSLIPIVREYCDYCNDPCKKDSAISVSSFVDQLYRMLRSKDDIDVILKQLSTLLNKTHSMSVENRQLIEEIRNELDSRFHRLYFVSGSFKEDVYDGKADKTIYIPTSIKDFSDVPDYIITDFSLANDTLSIDQNNGISKSIEMPYGIQNISLSNNVLQVDQKNGSKQLTLPYSITDFSISGSNINLTQANGFSGSVHIPSATEQGAVTKIKYYKTGETSATTATSADNAIDLTPILGKHSIKYYKLGESTQSVANIDTEGVFDLTGLMGQNTGVLSITYNKTGQNTTTTVTIDKSGNFDLTGILGNQTITYVKPGETTTSTVGVDANGNFDLSALNVNKLSQLTGDTTITTPKLGDIVYYTGSSWQNKNIVEMINSDAPLYTIVSELPTSDQKSNTIYIVPNTSSTDSQNVKTEYAWVDSKWEKLGEFKPDVDLSGYIQKPEGAAENQFLVYKNGSWTNLTITPTEGQVIYYTNNSWTSSSVDSLIKNYLDTNIDKLIKNYLNANIDSLIKKYLDANLDALLKKYLDAHINDYIKSYLDAHANEYIKNYLDANLDSLLTTKLTALGLIPVIWKRDTDSGMITPKQNANDDVTVGKIYSTEH